MGALAAEETEAQLLVRSREGDEGAFRELFRRHRDAVFRASYHVVKSHDEALDMVQESFLRAWRALDGFEERAGFRTWVRRIAVNLSLNRLRSKRRRPEASWPSEDLPAVDESTPRPAAAIEASERKRLLREAIERLPEAQRVAVRLHDLEGLTYGEIAEATGARKGTVMSRIHYGRLKLREALRSRLGPDAGEERDGDER